jgi:hypothetical protein
MELWIAIGLVFALAIVFLWRSRRVGTHGKGSLVDGMPDDLRDKNSGLGSTPNGGRPWSGGN